MTYLGSVPLRAASNICVTNHFAEHLPNRGFNFIGKPGIISARKIYKADAYIWPPR